MPALNLSAFHPTKTSSGIFRYARLAGLFGAVATLLAALAQQPAMPAIGFSALHVIPKDFGVADFRLLVTMLNTIHSNR